MVLTGGGTGGHLTPLLAVALSLRDLAARGRLPAGAEGEPPLELLYVGVVTATDRVFLERASIPFRHIPSGKIRRYLQGAPLTLVDMLFRLPRGIFRALVVLFQLMPDVVFSKGGYGSVPVVLAAWLYRIPILLHESDLVPGLANRGLARFASTIAVSFRAAEKDFPPAKVFVAGTPLRTEFRSLPATPVARERLGLHDRKRVLFVTGGSQGAQALNTVVLALLPKLLTELQVLHQVGVANLPAIAEFARSDLGHLPDLADYHPVGTLAGDEMAAAFAAADLVVSRAGGTALAEIAAAGKPSLLIPLRSAAQGHQWENAYFFREHGAAVVLDETNLTPTLFLGALRRLLENESDLRLMAERVRTLHRPGAAEDLAEVIVSLAAGKVPRRDIRTLAAGS